MDWQTGSAGSKSARGPPVTFKALAKMRAVLVLPVPRGPHEEVGMGDAAPRDGVAQRPHHMVLPHDVVKRLGAPFAGDDLVGGHGDGGMKSAV